ncbi:MAG: PspC domain-containing protein [Prevotella sp.]|nr:PspC domain-containing protein [Prevotella sp.]
MKKNFTINLCGRLYQIDEDAYDMLQHYMASLHSYFGPQPGGDEIANDIEERIAELFDELKQQGTVAITIDHVKDIITRIGRPEQLAGDDAERADDAGYTNASASSSASYAKQGQAPKKLYRNPNDKMVAGVLSGLAAYTDTDVTFWRLGTVLFTFFYGTGLLLYIVLAIVLPQANTPEEQLRMKGKEVNPQNLADVVVDDQQKQPLQTSGLREVFSIILKVIIGFFVALAVVIGGALAIAFLGVLMTTVFALLMPASHAVTMPFTLGGMGLADVWADHPAMLIGFVVALLTVLFIPVYAIVHMVLSLLKKIKPMGVAQRIVLIVIWIIALCCLVPLGGSIGVMHDEYEREHRAERQNWMSDFDRDYMKRNGWKLLKHENCHGSYSSSGEYFLGNDKAYLDAYDNNCMAVYQVETQLLPADSGYFRISCNARAQGEGVYIYATTPSAGNRPLAKTMVPVYGNTGGKLWEEAREQLNDSALAQRARLIREANDGRGFGWSPVEVYVRLEHADTLCYGVSTDPAFTGEPYSSEWFSACDFKVEKVEEK